MTTLGFRALPPLLALFAVSALHADEQLGISRADEIDVTAADNAIARYDEESLKRPKNPSVRDSITRMTVAGSGEWRVPVKMRRGAEGRMGMYSYGGEATLLHISEETVARFRFGYDRTQYDFKNANTLRWDDTHSYTLTGFFEQTISGNWGMYATGGIRLGYEDGASTDDAISGAFSVGARYRFSPHFTYYFGVNSIYRLDYNVIVTPMLSFDFKMGDWSVTTVNGLIVSYDIFGDKSLLLEGSVRFDMSDFRLKDEANTNYRRAVQFQEVPITFGVVKNFTPNFYIRAYTTFIAWSDYRFRTDNRNGGDFETDPGLAFGLHGGLRF